MRRFHWPLSLAMLSVLSFVGCTDDKKPAGGGSAGGGSGEQPAEVKDAPSDHGDKTDLGTLAVAGHNFGVMRLGELVPGKEGAFEVHPEGASADDLARWNLYLWVEDKEGTQLSAPSKGTREGSALHFHVTPRSGSTPVRVVLRLRTDGIDERAGLPLDGHGHEHKEGPHGGIPATFTGSGTSGHLELKLHDDKGDLELWLFQDEKLSKPFDLPLAAGIEIEFIDVNGRKISLRPRNQEKNEDEEGNPNVRDGKTNYFIYPTQNNEDASWLKGKEFQSIVVVRFSRDGTAFVSEEFVAKPHVH